jgi:DNA-binding transcriptional LysR family regulator
MFGMDNIPHMHVDLNLLPALDALLTEQSVVGAAERMHVSQPAMSRTLARLRRALDDELLVRSGHRMVPTPRALALRDEVRRTLTQAQRVLAPPRPTDLSTVHRTFAVRGHEALIMQVAGAAVLDAERRAPGVRLRFLPEPGSDDDALRTGEIDLDLGTGGPELSGVMRRRIGDDRLVVALRANHPAAADRLTAERYAELRHLNVSRRGRLTDQTDGVLADKGLTRTVVAAVGSVATALRLVAMSDLVTLVPSRLTGGVPGIEVRPVPLQLDAVPIEMSWHRRDDADPVHRWLRTIVEAALQPPPG